MLGDSQRADGGLEATLETILSDISECGVYGPAQAGLYLGDCERFLLSYKFHCQLRPSRPDGGTDPDTPPQLLLGRRKKVGTVWKVMI